MPRIPTLTRAVLVAAALSIPRLAQAQSLAGVVRATPTGAPVAGAVIQVVDSAGAPTAQTIAGRDGRYSIALAPLARTVIVRRIGFLPFTTPVPANARLGQGTLDVSLAVAPSTLPPMSSTAVGCPTNASATQGFALWEQARAAFLASVVSRSAAPARLLTLSFAQEVLTETVLSGNPRPAGNGPSTLTKAIRARVENRVGDRSWISGRTAEDFKTRGYIEMDGMSPVLYGPDADYLLDPSFEQRHCFSIAKPDAAHAKHIGVAFEPAKDGPSIPEIQGVLWLSESPLELRELVFTYVGRMAAPNGRSGGRLTFRTAENGIALIEQWGLYYPSIAYLATALDARGGGRMAVSSNDPRVQVVGGSLIGAQWPDGTKIARPHPLIGGLVSDSKTGEPVKKAMVFLDDGYQMVTADDGAYAFNPVMPGRYSVSAVDSLWTHFGIERVGTATVDAFEGGRMATAPTIKLAPLLDVVRAQYCRTTSMGKGQGIVAVRAVDSTGARVAASFKFVNSGVERVWPERGGTAPAQVACGVAAGPVTVTATSGPASGSVTINASGAGAMIDTGTVVLRRGR
jgi:hypothetical protein